MDTQIAVGRGEADLELLERQRITLRRERGDDRQTHGFVDQPVEREW